MNLTRRLRGPRRAGSNGHLPDVAAVLAAAAHDGDGWVSAADVTEKTGLPAFTVYLTLSNLVTRAAADVRDDPGPAGPSAARRRFRLSELALALGAEQLPPPPLWSRGAMTPPRRGITLQSWDV